MRITAVFIAALLSTSSLAAQSAQKTALPQKARDAYNTAQSLEAELNEKPEAERTRSDYLKVVKAYQRVYLITPHTGYADNSLMTVARLYEEMKSTADAVKTLQFLMREYPGTPFRDLAERDLARLSGTKIQKIAAVDNVRYWENQNSLRVIVDLGGEVQFVQGEAKNPDRIFLDLSPAKLNSMLIGKQWPVKSDLLQQIRVGQYDASTVRVVLDVGTVGHINSFMLRDPDRLVIDVLGTESVISAANSSSNLPAPPPAAEIRPAVENKLPAESKPIVTPVAATTAVSKPPIELADVPVTTTKAPPSSANIPVVPAAKTDEVEVKSITPAKTPGTRNPSLVRSLGLKLSRVVIDAGHGGHDTGSIGQNGYTEKELVLDVAQRLKKLIQSELGAEVIMTRGDDVFVPLETRTSIANQQQADLFISIHANSSRTRSVRGVETYFLNFTSYSRDALETASRENAASERSIHDLQDLVKKIMLQDKVDESRELAKHISKAMAARKGAGVDRGVKQAPFVVLVGANMPSVLAEIAFISNPQDEKQARTAEIRQAIAESLFEGVRSYAETLSGTKTAKTQDKTN